MGVLGSTTVYNCTTITLRKKKMCSRESLAKVYLSFTRSSEPIKSPFPRFSGWWFGTFFIFPYIGNNHPNWLIFFRGVQTTNQFYHIASRFEFPRRCHNVINCKRYMSSLHRRCHSFQRSCHRFKGITIVPQSLATFVIDLFGMGCTWKAGKTCGNDFLRICTYNYIYIIRKICFMFFFVLVRL